MIRKSNLYHASGPAREPRTRKAQRWARLLNFARRRQVIEAGENLATLLGRIDLFRKDRRAVVAVEMAILFPVLALLILGGLILGLAEINAMAVTSGTRNAANAAQVSSSARNVAAIKQAVCAGVPLSNCADALQVVFDPGSPGNVATITATLPLDLTAIPFLNLGVQPFTAVANYVVPQ